jgi:hypothetical protein
LFHRAKFIRAVRLRDVARSTNDGGESSIGELASLGSVSHRTRFLNAGYLFDQVNDRGVFWGV